jgi:uncharacterized membrane protein
MTVTTRPANPFNSTSSNTGPYDDPTGGDLSSWYEPIYANTYDESQDAPTEADKMAANALGWFSLALGLTQILIPKRMAKLIGVRDNRKTRMMMRAVGLREIAAGAVIFTQNRPVLGLRARALGDIMDLMLLGAAFQSRKSQRERLMAATAAVLGVFIPDMFFSERLNHPDAQSYGAPVSRDSVHVEKSITVNSPVAPVYEFWREFENLPRFMSHLKSVIVTGPDRSHWVAKAPAGKSVEWDAEIIDERRNELISWRSLEGADVANSGTVRFNPAPGGRGTEVHVSLHYDPPAGHLGVTIAKLFGEEPEIQVADDLRAFKQVVETGEVVRSEGSVTGERLKHRPARPSDAPNN